MNDSFQAVITARDDERRDLFLIAARRLGTAVQNVEKDFWVCWILDALFNGLPAGGPRLLFKGGTSLSKAFGLISRFSEDIDVTVFRGDLGEGASVEDLESLSGKKRRARLEAIKAACQTYINGPLIAQLNDVITSAMQAAAVPHARFRLEPDPDDADRQSLLFWYPTVSARERDYIRSAVKIESGAKSALDPHVAALVRPYIDDDLPELDLAVANVTTVRPERTFWDKAIILHGLRQWHDRRGELRHGGQRVSRHYYDVFRLLQAETVEAWFADDSLARDCASHARLFFNSADLDLARATAGTFTLTPTPSMRDALARDYEAMAAMVFGPAPSLEEVLSSVSKLETRLNESRAE